ncbi:hypothetical protein ABL78_0581 [Leptomonas seymouri]|uniref:Uncharacterized protein n=1 Tax=Leptomonas seymouri TaxID=5684 RepID=A0A0N1PE76_LEPSE|nr:hypothetical protein ABL78_0581 [Leptomonas seymouri]|eukprot:KPI90354.1 hypothetical protein ABL78_0581 [Leptomonas seymouri]
MPRIKRFDEVDTDSDHDFREEAPVRKPMPTLSFKTETEETESIAFESDNEKSQHSEHSRAPAPPQPSNPAKTEKTPPPATTAYAVKAVHQQHTPSPVHGSTSSTAVAAQAVGSASSAAKMRGVVAAPTFPAAAAPAKGPEPTQPIRVLKDASPLPAASTASTGSYTPRVTSDRNRNTEHYHNDPENSEHESDDFVQQVLPVPRRQGQLQQPQPSPSAHRPPAPGVTQLCTSGSTDVAELSRVRSTPAETTTDELLIRAQLRLEERRRHGNSVHGAGSRQPSPWKGPPPVALTPYRDSAALQPNTLMPPLSSADPWVRRLQQENARLQDEVAFLGRENQKMRGVHGSADASEAVRLQLTVDMLRKELETKHVAFQRAVDDACAEKKEALRQAGEAMEQCESYQCSAEQYKQLYSEKQREVEKVKTQLQALLYDVNTMEQRHREVEAEFNEKIANEREKAERALALSEEIKGQREHLHFLNEQLRSEVTVAAEAKRQALDQAALANDAARRDRADSERRIEQLNEDIAQLRKALADRERVQSAQLREAQQAQAVLQDRLKEQAEEQQREADRSRRTVEAMKEEQKRVVQQERARRAETEERLRRVEEEARANQTRYAASVGAESESRVRKFREELQAERVSREAAEREALRLATEVEELREASEYYQRECQRMSVDFAQSEQLREKAERQCVSLSHTLEDLMTQEETHARQIEQLQEALSAGQWSSAGAAGRNAGVDGMMGDLRQLSDENDRLTSECTRLAEERDHLIEENGKIAEELLKWKREMRQYVASHVRSPSPQARRVKADAQ